MQRFAPFLFVLLWSTGFIGAKFGLPHAEPLSFLLVRYLLVIALMTVIALATARALAARRRRSGSISASPACWCMRVYLGGVFVAIEHGLPAGVTAWWSACSRC